MWKKGMALLRSGRRMEEQEMVRVWKVRWKEVVDWEVAMWARGVVEVARLRWEKVRKGRVREKRMVVVEEVREIWAGRGVV